MIPSLDMLRLFNPTLGFAVYAMEPGGLVTLEVIDETGGIFTFKGETLEQAISIAFPPDPMFETPKEEAEASIFD